MSAKCSSYMYGTPYIFHFVHPLVKTAEIMVQRVNFERNLKNIRPATVTEKKHLKSLRTSIRFTAKMVT